MSPRSTPWIWIIAGLAATIAPAFADDASEVEGQWHVMWTNTNDRGKVGDNAGACILTRRLGKQAMTVDGKLFSVRNYKVKVEAKPKQISYTDPNNPQRPADLHIYEITGDTMRVATFTDMTRRSTDYPADFEPRAGVKVIGYRRVQMEAKP